MEIKYTERALLHLDNIQKYLIEHAPEYTAPVINRLLDKIDSLERMPQRGIAIPEWLDEADDTREIYFHPYCVAYLLEKDTITILSVLHQKQKRKRYKKLDK